jgi:hypothetical protein
MEGFEETRRETETGGLDKFFVRDFDRVSRFFCWIVDGCGHWDRCQKCRSSHPNAFRHGNQVVNVEVSSRTCQRWSVVAWLTVININIWLRMPNGFIRKKLSIASSICSVNRGKR